MNLYRSLKDYHQKEPIRILFKHNGITIWKWCGAIFPEISLFLGRWHFAINTVFHSGRGLIISMPNILVIHWAYIRRITWWHKYRFHFIIFNKEFFCEHKV